MSPKETSDNRGIHTNGYELYIMRHGIAVERASAGFADDSRRPLTPEGKKKMKEIAAGLIRAGFDVDWVVSSPLIRAEETAEIVAEEIGPGVARDSCDALAPGGSPEALITFLAKHPNRKRVLVVGHEPDLGELAARLMGAGRHANLAFKKGGCCLLTFLEFPPKSPGQLVWWLTPRLARKMA